MVAAEALPGLFHKRAGEQFALGNDKEAHLFRDLATECRSIASDLRSEFNKKWRAVKYV